MIKIINNKKSNSPNRRNLKGIDLIKKNFFDNFFNIGDTTPLFDSVERINLQSRFTEDEKNFYLETDIPGVNKEDIKIDISSDNVIKIEGERKEYNEERKGREHFSEKIFGSFYREFSLPNSVDRNSIKAEYKNGVLALKLPKLKGEESKEIKIS
jgi:HSP20 family molecular chaperone IbpA